MTIKFLLSNLIVYMIFNFSWASLFAQENIAVIDSLIGKIADEQVLNPGMLISDTLTVYSPENANSLTQFAALTLANKLKNGGYKVFQNGRLSGPLFEIAHVSLSIKYGEPYSDGIFGKDLAQREVFLKLVGQIRIEPSGKVLKSINAEKTFSDVINYDNIEELEASSYSFTQGERERYSGWDKIIEPAIIITSVVVIVLLFFTQRA